MLDLEVSTTIYIWLALGYKESKGGGENIPLRGKKPKTTNILLQK